MKIKGFTLIELLVVIAVIGVLAGTTIALIDPVERIDQGRDLAEEHRLRAFAKAMEEYAITNGDYYIVTCSGGVGGFNCASQALVASGSLKTAIPSQENGYTLFFYSFDNMNSTALDGSMCTSGSENCVRFVVYNYLTSFKSKSYKQKYGDGTNAFLVYDSKYQKICGRSTNPHNNPALSNCD
ncbi:MAG: type II secretion system protein [bacterium]|nr:type II secretion system protein [bacterium]